MPSISVEHQYCSCFSSPLPHLPGPGEPLPCSFLPSVRAPPFTPSLPERTTEAEALLHVFSPCLSPRMGDGFCFYICKSALYSGQKL